MANQTWVIPVQHCVINSELCTRYLCQIHVSYPRHSPLRRRIIATHLTQIPIDIKNLAAVSLMEPFGFLGDLVLRKYSATFSIKSLCFFNHTSMFFGLGIVVYSAKNHASYKGFQDCFILFCLYLFYSTAGSLVPLQLNYHCRQL